MTQYSVQFLIPITFHCRFWIYSVAFFKQNPSQHVKPGSPAHLRQVAMVL